MTPLLENLENLILAIDLALATPLSAAVKYAVAFLSHTNLKVLRLNMVRSQPGSCKAIMNTLIGKQPNFR